MIDPSSQHAVPRPAGIDGWWKSSLSTGAMACVAVRRQGNHWMVADTKNFPGDRQGCDPGPVLVLADSTWQQVQELLASQRSGVVADLSVLRVGRDEARLLSLATGATMTFSAAEITAFLTAAGGGEFDQLVR